MTAPRKTDHDRNVSDVIEELRDLLSTDSELEERTMRWLEEQIETSGPLTSDEESK